MTFEAGLKALCKKHNIFISGTLRIRTGEKWDEKTFKIKREDVVFYGQSADRMGPFITCDINEVPQQAVNCNTGLRAMISSDAAGYDCPVTGKWIDGRAAHRENLKRTGCRVFEPGEKQNFEKEKPREMDRNAEIAADFLSDRIAERWNA